MRVEGEALSASSFGNPTRLVAEATYDSAHQVIGFLVPSLSRKAIVYRCEVDCTSGECACGCEAFRDFREAVRMPYSRPHAGVYAEFLALAKGKYLAPLITRPERALCPHLRRCRSFIQRHGLMPVFRTIEETLTARLESMPDKEKCA